MGHEGVARSDPPAHLAGLQFRRLEAGDAGAFFAFYNALSEQARRTFRPLGVVASEQACEGVIADNLPENNVKYDLAAFDGAAILAWSFLWGLDTEAPIFGLCVADDWRGQGLGGYLMDRILAQARAQGLARIELTVVQDNRTAIALYARRGFVLSGAFVGEDGLPYYRMRREQGAGE